MTNEKPTDKPTPQQIESQQFSMREVEAEFSAALKSAMAEVEAGRARPPRYQFRDGIRDADHLEHITITDLDGTILYDQDFDLENAIIARVDAEDN